MELFLSTYVNKVDRKGRVSVPATFRSTLATHHDPNMVIAFPSPRLLAIECTGSDRIAEMHQRTETVALFSEDYENMTQTFADVTQLTIDGDGRVILPEKLKNYAHIEGEIAFVGRGAMFQLWDPARYEAYSATVRERVRRFGTPSPPGGGTANRG